MLEACSCAQPIETDARSFERTHECVIDVSYMTYKKPTLGRRTKGATVTRATIAETPENESVRAAEHD